jgi:hypothetical protein
MNFTSVKKTRISGNVVDIVSSGTSHNFISALYKGLLACIIDHVFAVIFILFEYIPYLC